MIVSDRIPPEKAPGSLEPLGRWSVPITSTVSVEVTMFPPGASALETELGTEPL